MEDVAKMMGATLANLTKQLQEQLDINEDLLAALEWLLKCIYSDMAGDDVTQQEWRGVIDATKAAIAKAKGEGS